MNTRYEKNFNKSIEGLRRQIMLKDIDLASFEDTINLIKKYLYADVPSDMKINSLKKLLKRGE